ncbi:MAG: YncE family protein [Actinobacteria bacterium]|nr:YncE family protein [Actinomycetota bacterium]
MRLGNINSRGGTGPAAIALIITGIAASLIAGCAPAVPATAPKAAPAKAGKQGKLVHARHQRARPAMNVYAHIGAGMMNPRWASDPYRIYVPNSLSNTVTEINPRSYKVIRTFAVGQQPNHITPSWNGTRLWVNNTDSSSLTPVSPATGRPGRPVPVADPYNLYFTPGGRYAMVMAEALNRINFLDPRTMRLRHSMPVPCSGVNHLDFTASGHYALASCEFSGQLLWIDVPARKVVTTIRLGKPMSSPMTPPGPGYSMPQDVRLSANGKIFYVADMAANGVWLVSARRARVIRFLHTGTGTHGFLVSRNGKDLFISNRGEGSISVLDFATSKLVHKWRIPGGGSPDMGGISPDGRVMWWSGRYNGVVYAMSTSTGRLLARIPVGAGPHGVCVFPQPGRYSLGHTGNFR